MMNWLDTLWANMTMTTLWGNNMVQYLSAILLAIGSYLVLRVFRNRVIIYVKRRTKATRDKRDDVIVSSICEIPSYFYWMISLFVAVQSLSVSSEITMAVDALFVIIVLGQIAFAIKRIILALMTAGKDEEHV